MDFLGRCALVLANVVQDSAIGDDHSDVLLGHGQPHGYASTLCFELPESTFHYIPSTGETTIEMLAQWVTMTSIGLHQPLRRYVGLAMMRVVS